MNQSRLKQAKWRRRVQAPKRRFGFFELLLLLLAFVLLLTVLRQAPRVAYTEVRPSDIDREYSSARLQADFAFLLRTLEQVHPNLYFKVSREEITAESQRIEAELNRPMTRLEFYRLVAPLVGRFGDGHTTATPPAEERKEYTAQGALLFPLDLKADESGVTVLHNFTSDSLVNPGTRVQAINGVPIAEIENRLLLYISGERDAWKRAVLNQRFRWQMWLVFGFESPFEVTVERPTNRGVTLVNRTFLGITLDTLKKDLNAVRTDAQPAPYTFTELHEPRLPGIGLLDFNSFRDYDRFDSFLDSTFRVVQQDSLRDLIIDVRDNGGGNSRLGDRLINYIWDKPVEQVSQMDVKVSKQIKGHFASWLPWYLRWYPPLAGDFFKRIWAAKPGEIVEFTAEPEPVEPNPLRFKGHVYLLTDAGTFSSAAMFATALKDYHIATVIGGETGGLATAYGEMYSFQLPNTHLGFSSSCKRFLRPSGVDDGRGVIPDIEPNPADFGRRPPADLDLATALEQIRLERQETAGR